MRPKRTAKKPAKGPHRVGWQLEVVPWMICLGMLLGFGAEVFYWENNFLWMTGGSIAGAMVGGVCDTALFLYRRCRQKRI